MLYFDKYNEFLAQKGLSLDRSKQDNILFRSVNPLTLEFFISETDPSQIKTILEIGRSNGYSFGFFRFAFPQAKVISVDIVRTKTSEKVAQLFDNNFLFVDGTSEELKKINSIYDLVFIDGEHTFEWAKRDWGNVQPFLSSNAVVFFDDLDWGDCGVMRFFESLNNKNKHICYINGAPICGVIHINREGKIL